MIATIRLVVLLVSFHIGTNPFFAASSTRITGRAMGTTWSVRLVPPERGLDVEAVRLRIAQRLESLEAIFSTYRPHSELSRFNSSGSTRWIVVSPELLEVAVGSSVISTLTHGAFDPSVLPLVQLWGFGTQRRSEILPNAQEIETAKDKVDWRRLEIAIESRSLRKMRSDLTLDFASMAKGFAVDAVCAELTAVGVAHYSVQVGGDLRTGGLLDGKPWRIGIEIPRDGDRALARTLPLAGHALSTSGDQRNFFQIGRRRYGHIIDPRTGEPVMGSLASVSVVAPTCARSSALATALFILGETEGFRLANEEDLTCLFILRDGERLVQRATPAFERQFPSSAESGSP